MSIQCPNPRCSHSNPDGAVLCCMCGRKLSVKKGRRTRANGMGTAYRRGRTWTASIIVGWRDIDGSPMPVKRTKGGFVTKKEAQEYCGVLRGDKRRSSNLTFCQIYEQWESFYCGKIGKSTLNCYRAARKYYADIEYLRFSDIGLDDLQDCLDSCPRGKRTKENMKALGTLLYKYALPRHLAEMNYAQYIDCGDDKKHPRNALTLEHVEMIRAAIGCIKYADYVYCLIYTGFRPNEMLRLTVDDYDSANETLTGGSKTDAGIDRPITLSPKITPIVKRLASTAHPYLFPKPDGKQMRDDYFRESCFYQLLDELRIQSVPKVGEQALYTPYSCRHTFANLMKNVSGSDTDKAALMGHTSPEMTKYYQSADLASLRAITDKL